MDSQKMKYIEHAKSGKYNVCVWGAGFLGTQKGLQLLYKNEISIDYYCDNNSELWGKEIIDGIKCISPMELQKKENVICFLMLTYNNAVKVLKQLQGMGIEQVIFFDELFIEEKEEYFPFMKEKRIAFYTCITGGYDNVIEPQSILPECDYYLISDKKPEQETVFQYLDINDFLPSGDMDNTRKNRYCKLNAHKIFPKYRYSVYFDGTVQLKSSIIKYVDELPKTRIMTFGKKPWKSPYMEAMHVLNNRRDLEDIVKKQIERYWLEGLPEDFGIVYCTILIREHNNPICKKLMEDWWEQVKQFSRRDQISFPYVLWKNGYTMDDVKTMTDIWEYEGEYWKMSKTHNQPRLMHEGRIVF